MVDELKAQVDKEKAEKKAILKEKNAEIEALKRELKRVK